MMERTNSCSKNGSALLPRKRACLDADAAPPSVSEDELAQLRARCAVKEQELEEMRHRVLQLEWREELWRDVARRAVSARETAPWPRTCV